MVSRSKREIPHYYLATTIDFHAAATWLRERNASAPVTERILPIALLLKATALAAAAYPDMNGHFVDGEFRPASNVRLGVLVALRPGGLVTPVIETAEQLAVADLNQRLRDVATRAKTGKLRGSEVGDPTLTVTNLGEQGVDVVTATLSADHRASDGHRGALFLTATAEHLNHPEEL